MSDGASERIMPLVSVLATIAVAVLMPHEPALADVLGCAETDQWCINDVLGSRCSEPGTTVASCEALARAAEAVWVRTRSTSAGELLGQVYYSLAERADDENVALSFRQSSRAVLLAVVAADEQAIGAYKTLAVLDYESPAQRNHWLRRVVAIEPSRFWVESLASALLSQRTLGGYFEAIDVYEEQYRRARAGSDKWRWAGFVYGLLTTNSIRFGHTRDPLAIAELESRVRRDSDWNAVLTTLSAPSVNPEGVATALETACGLAAIFGPGPCLDGIERTVLAAIRVGGQDARLLADAAAHGIRTAPRQGRNLNEDLRAPRRQFARWLLEFTDYGLDSMAVLEAIASISEAHDHWIEARREIVRREPDNGEARFQLGKVYYDQDRWAEAIPELERARELLPEEDRYSRIDSRLRHARYELAAGR